MMNNFSGEVKRESKKAAERMGFENGETQLPQLPRLSS